MRIEISFQNETAQYNFDCTFPDVIYCFNSRTLLVDKMLKEASKFGRGVLHVMNGKTVVYCLPF